MKCHDLLQSVRNSAQLVLPIFILFSPYAVSQLTLCEQYGQRVDEANSEMYQGGAYSKLVDGKCVITVLPNSQLKKKVTLWDAKLPIVLKPSRVTNQETAAAEGRQEVDVSFITPSITEPSSKKAIFYPVYSPRAGEDHDPDDSPLEPTISAAPHFEDEVLLELPASVVVKNGFIIDRSQLKPTSSGCYHSGLALFGALISGDVSGVSFSDAGVAACNQFYMGRPDFTAPANKFRQAPKNKGGGGGGGGAGGTKGKSKNGGSHTQKEETMENLPKVEPPLEGMVEEENPGKILMLLKVNLMVTNSKVSRVQSRRYMLIRPLESQPPTTDPP